MLGQVGLCATGHADGVLQVPAYREDGRNGVRQGHAARDISPGAADEGRGPGDHAGDAVVAADQDVAVMGDDAVGDAGKPFLRFPVGDRQGFAERIGAGHDQGEVLRLVQPCHPGRPAGRFVEQQVVQGRIGQHDARSAPDRAPRRRGFPRELTATSDDRALGAVISAASASEISAMRRALDRLATIRAKGLPLRCFIARRRLTVPLVLASQARWKPPKPFSATISPARRRATISSIRMESCGPQAGQAVGWAWKRRSRGSWYSRAQSGQRVKPAMEVCGLS